MTKLIISSVYQFISGNHRKPRKFISNVSVKFTQIAIKVKPNQIMGVKFKPTELWSDLYLIIALESKLLNALLNSFITQLSHLCQLKKEALFRRSRN